MEYKKYLRTKESIRDYRYIKRKIDKISKEFFFNGFQYWCVFREVDAIACSVYVLETMDEFNKKYELNNLEKLKNTLELFIQRDELLKGEEDVVYEKILDIAYILKYLIIGKKSCDLNRKSLKYTLKGIIDDIGYGIQSMIKK